jgi:phage terminase large subunit-like protein
VDDVEVHAEVLADYIQELGQNYQIEMVALDSYRYQLMSAALKKIGFSVEEKNLKLVSRLDIMRFVPVIDSCFVNGYYSWGDNPTLRWAVNNAKLIPYGKQKGQDQGSFIYGKIEAKSRKTDPWMALVASQVCEEMITYYEPIAEDAEVIVTF